MSTRVEFRLTMPGVGSWNGRWSGGGAYFAIVRRLGSRALARLGVTTDAPRSWTYAWTDGWCACITARVVPSGERLPKSAGFWGYEWMVRSILQYGEILATPREVFLAELEGQ